MSGPENALSYGLGRLYRCLTGKVMLGKGDERPSRADERPGSSYG